MLTNIGEELLDKGREIVTRSAIDGERAVDIRL